MNGNPPGEHPRLQAFRAKCEEEEYTPTGEAWDIIKLLEGERQSYRKAYHLLMDYWDDLPDEQKPLIHQKLLLIFEEGGVEP